MLDKINSNLSASAQRAKSGICLISRWLADQRLVPNCGIFPTAPRKRVSNTVIKIRNMNCSYLNII